MRHEGLPMPLPYRRRITNPLQTTADGALKLLLPRAVTGLSDDLADEKQSTPTHRNFQESLTVIDAVGRYFQDYAVFWGRTSREDFWWVALFTALVVFFSALLEAHVKSVGADLMALYVCATIVPFTAIGVRRLHDANLSGWWVFVGLVPIVGQLIALVFFLTPGTRGPNRYGDDPRGAQFGAAT
jgi:uncharacterized membrane protein YhaH (DUF805 family)